MSNSDAKGTQVLWTKPLAAFTGTSDYAFWIGGRQLRPHRVVILLRTKKTRVHVITIDPADGTVRDSKGLFDKAAPGT